MVKLTLPYPPAKLNPNARIHWAPKNKVFQKYKFDCKVLASQVEPMTSIRITFHPPDKRRRDRDNIISAFKAGQDGVAAAWGIDDSELEITYTNLGEPVKGGCVIVERG